MAVQIEIADRYRVLDPLGEGGMGIVYRALDLRTNSYVALKTMRDMSEPGAVELFTREWGVLASISHPNIIDIRDVGEIEDRGELKPFFVMPLLSGQTLAAMVAGSSPRLTVERVVDIMCQVCRGLHAAHDQGLIHRDIKPSNIFVMDDDSIKIIDFGIAHLAGVHSVTGLKGTWQYMSPEQTDLKQATALSDIFSLGVVCYEVLTGMKPFARKTQIDTVEAIRRHIPTPISEVNPAASQLVSMVIHKAMAKQPIHRFSSAREFEDALRKARMNQPLERFDRARIQPRIDRAKKAFAEGDYAFSSEILTELESEGHIDKEITLLRVQVEQASRRNRVRQLIEGAKARLEQDEVPLALEKLQAVLDIDPDNPDALALSSTVEKQRNERQIESWLHLAERHMDRHDFTEARLAMHEVLKVRPNDAAALDLLTEIGRREQESHRIRAEKEKLYGSAVDAYQNGEISSALSRLERILELGRQTPDAAVPERDAIYQTFYNQVRSERDAIHNAYDECRRQFSERNFSRALEMCDEFLAAYPGDALLQALRLEAVEQQRQELSTYIAEIGKRVDAEPDLDRKINILKEASERYPGEQQFQQLLKLTRERRDLVVSIVTKARQYEDRGQFNEAIGQWDILRNIYPKYPGIDFEVAQLQRRREQQAKEEAKARLVEQIDRALESSDFTRAGQLAASALSEYPRDQELAALERLASQGLGRGAEARKLYAESQDLSAENRLEEARETLRRASQLNPKDPLVRDALRHALVEHARAILESDWREAEPLVQEAATLDGAHTDVRHLRSLVTDSKRKESVSQALAEAREQQAADNLPSALEVVEGALAVYPNEVRLLQLQATLHNTMEEARRRTERNGDVESLRTLARQLQQNPVDAELVPMLAQSRAIVRKHPDDPEIGSVAAEIQECTNYPISAPPSRAPDDEEPPSVGNKTSFTPGMVIAAGILILGAAMVFSSLPRAKTKRQTVAQAAISTMAVRIRTIPSGASITVNGQKPPVDLKLDPNTTYRVVASYPGYRTFDRPALRPAPEWNFTLEPELVHLRISAGEMAGTVLVDGREIGSTPDVEWAPDLLEHTLSVNGPSGELLAVKFKAEPGAEPTVSAIQPKDAIVIVSLGSNATVYSGAANSTTSLSGQPPQPIPAEGLKLAGLTPSNALTFDRKDLPKVSIDTGNAPSVSVILNPGTNLGSIYIISNVDNARLLVEGQEIRQAKKGGWWIQRRPGKYALKITADRWEDFEENIEFVKGAAIQRRIELRPHPALATLLIQAGTPGADVLLDGIRIATLDVLGSARLDAVTPGQHKIALRKEFFEPMAATSRPFTAGQAVTLGANEVHLKEFGTLAFHISPSEAQVTYRRSDQQETHSARTGESVRLAEGRYVVVAQADGYIAKTAGDIPVGSGRTTTADLALNRPAAKSEPVSALPLATSLFQNPSRVEQAGGWWRGTGSGYLFLQSGLRHVTLTFANPGKGHFGRSKKVEWVAHYINDTEKVTYELDGSKLTRHAAGKTTHIDHQSYTISMTISPGQIVITADGQILDTYRAEGQDLTTGLIGIKAGALFTVTEP